MSEPGFPGFPRFPGFQKSQRIRSIFVSWNPYFVLLKSYPILVPPMSELALHLIAVYSGASDPPVLISSAPPVLEV